MPNGKKIGLWFGDTYADYGIPPNLTIGSFEPPKLNLSQAQLQNRNLNQSLEFWESKQNSANDPNALEKLLQAALLEIGAGNGIAATTNRSAVKSGSQVQVQRKTEAEYAQDESTAISQHPWGLVVTVLGTVLLDFDADACQSPARAYMLDVTIPGNWLH